MDTHPSPPDQSSAAGELSPPGDRSTDRTDARPVTVAGILVVHDGAPWLNECLDALALQTRPLDRLIIVDTGSVDDSREMVAAHDRIRAAIGEVVSITQPRSSTFGQAVARAVVHLAGDQVDWLWLLHDDSAAFPEALAHLLGAARRSPSVGVAGPKLSTWDDPFRLLEVGQRITRSGGRAGGPSTGEPDQGQHDQRSDVLGVNTSGMLIRHEVFELLRGFDPRFGQFGADLDLCWRAHLAGHRVVVVPRARVREAAASTSGRRSADLSPAAARRRARRQARQVALARCSPYAVPFLALWIAASSVVSAAVLLVVKRPRSAWEQLGDLGSLLTPWRPTAARWRARGLRQVRRRDLRGLFVTHRAGFRHAVDTVHDAVAFEAVGSVDNGLTGAQALESGPVSDDSEPLEERAVTRGVTLRILSHPGFLAVLVGALLSVATWRSLLADLISTNGLGVAGGELFPNSTDASGLWHAWLDGWHGPGLGGLLESAPYLPVLAGLAWVLEHLPFIDVPASSVGASIGWLLAGSMPSSAWTAYLGARVATHAPWPRAWAALAWASLATLTTAQAGGRLGAVVAHILLPLVAAGFVCAARRSRPVWATFGAALALAVTGAFNPALGVLGAVAALVLLLLGHGATRIRALVLLLVPVALLGPWVLRLVDDPLLLLAGPGLTFWQAQAPAPWQLAMLHPGGSGSYPVLLSAPIVLAGVVAMLRREAVSGAMTVLALVAVTGLAVGVASPHVVIGLIPQGMAGAGDPITMWAGTGLDVGAMALIAAAVLGADGLSSRLSRSGFGWRQILVAPVVAAAVVGVLASVALAGWVGAGRTLGPALPNMPAVAADQAEGPLANRLLVLTNDADTIGYQLLGREPGKVVRDLSTPAGAPDPSLAATVQITVASQDPTSVNAARDGLADLAIGFVAFRGTSTDPLVRRLDATAGMTRLSDSRGLILWRVQPRDNAASSSRLRLEDPPGAPLQTIDVTGDHARADVSLAAAPAGGSAIDRRLVVAEPPGWAGHVRVTYAGRELAAVGGPGQPTYDLPAGAGQLTVTPAPTHPWWRLGQLGLLFVVVFLALPFGSSRSRRQSSRRQSSRRQSLRGVRS